MPDSPVPAEARRPVVRPSSELQEAPGGQTPGMRRRHAFAGDDRWVGHVETEPGEWSGWHHHGATDTYMYVLEGTLEFEYGTAGETVRVGPGDFAHMPAGVVHRERTTPGEPGQIVLMRFGPGPAVVNVEAPHDHA